LFSLSAELTTLNPSGRRAERAMLDWTLTLYLRSRFTDS
jgi:hypothetical protein